MIMSMRKSHHPLFNMDAPRDKHVLVAGFTVIPIKFNNKSKAQHHLYVKEHSVRESHVTKPRDKTLFVLNVPPYCNKECLERLFSTCGPVQRVYIHKKPTSGEAEKVSDSYFAEIPDIKGFKVAYVVFGAARSVQKAKKMSSNEPHILSTDEYPVDVGLKKWCAKYRNQKVDGKKLQKEIDQFMETHDQRIENEKEAAKLMENVVDEDGWITVTKHGRNKGVPRTEAQEQKISRKEKRKRKQKELLNFYSFQLRESKREHIAKLRQKFEEDKEKIAAMKSARKFKPY